MGSMNITTSALSSIGTTYSSFDFSWVVTVVVFIVIFITIFLLSKNFRQFIVGSLISGVVLVVYVFSRWVAVSASEGNRVPLNWFRNIVIFIFVSIFVGKIMYMFKWFQKLEKGFMK